jgi:hypothetical protein
VEEVVLQWGVEDIVEDLEEADQVEYQRVVTVLVQEEPQPVDKAILVALVVLRINKEVEVEVLVQQEVAQVAAQV